MTASLDGRRLARVVSSTHVSGQAGLAVAPWRHAEFDDLAVTPVAPAGDVRYLPGQWLSATGTGFHHGYEPRKAVDGSVESMWHSEWSPRAALPQAVTVDTGRTRRISQVTYQPREDGNHNGVITRYELATSVDGVTYTRVASGTWPLDATRKSISLPDVEARYVRLTAIEGAADTPRPPRSRSGFRRGRARSPRPAPPDVSYRAQGLSRSPGRVAVQLGQRAVETGPARTSHRPSAGRGDATPGGLSRVEAALPFPDGRSRPTATLRNISVTIQLGSPPCRTE